MTAINPYESPRLPETKRGVSLSQVSQIMIWTMLAVLAGMAAMIFVWVLVAQIVYNEGPRWLGLFVLALSPIAGISVILGMWYHGLQLLLSLARATTTRDDE